MCLSYLDHLDQVQTSWAKRTPRSCLRSQSRFKTQDLLGTTKSCSMLFLLSSDVFWCPQNPVILYDFDGLDRKLMCVVLPTWDTERLSPHGQKSLLFRGLDSFRSPKWQHIFPDGPIPSRKWRSLTLLSLGPRSPVHPGGHQKGGSHETALRKHGGCWG